MNPNETLRKQQQRNKLITQVAKSALFQIIRKSPSFATDTTDDVFRSCSAGAWAYAIKFVEYGERKGYL